MYSNARAAASSHQDLQRHITEAMVSKAEWESKVQVLQQELRALANATPELLEQLRYEADELQGAVAAAEAEKRAFEDQTAGLRASKAQLTARVEEVRSELKTVQVWCYKYGFAWNCSQVL
jgi:chromosome segregation ATPase